MNLPNESPKEPADSLPLLSIVAPVYNEESVLPEFHRRLCAVLDKIDGVCEIVYVNDGSTDSSLDFLSQLHQTDARVALVNLSRNFGKEVAMTAGLDHTRGEAVVVIDTDLQDPPELIPDLIAKWHVGFDVVYATRISRDGETLLKKRTAQMFYRLMKWVSRVEIPVDTGDFRLLSRRAVDAVCQLREQHRFMKGLFAWIGYAQTSVPYRRDTRFAGETKFNYWKLWNFALEGITSFTIAPLRLASYLGLFVAAGSFLYGAWIIYKTIQYGDPVAGYPSTMATILFVAGVQLTTLGIIGEYLGRMFNEAKRRPLYFVEDYLEPRGHSHCRGVDVNRDMTTHTEAVDCSES